MVPGECEGLRIGLRRASDKWMGGLLFSLVFFLEAGSPEVTDAGLR